MEMRIHTQGGSVETFFQYSPAHVASILKGIQSTKVFATNNITIAGDYSLTTFVTSRVNRVDLMTKISLSGNIPLTFWMSWSCPRTNSESEAI